MNGFLFCINSRTKSNEKVAATSSSQTKIEKEEIGNNS